ncbi:MAG: hypothetical protein NUV46_03015 [Nanoarchaeota archaeon]|nr:hypothetical protein [Nanoarchaeota archaeon]
MLEHTSDEVRLKALIGVVRNLIENSRNTEIFRLDEIIKENSFLPSRKITKEEIREKIKEEVKEKIKEEIQEKIEKENSMRFEGVKVEEKLFRTSPPIQKKVFPITQASQQNRPPEFKVKRVLKIPKVSFPNYLRSVKPVPSERASIDLGKLNPFIEDRNVTSLESEGENEPVYVMGSMGRKPTNLRLSKREIDEVINRFSEQSRIPKSQGMFKVAVGKLLLTAMLSNSVSSRFVIEKIKGEEIPQRPY